MVNTRTATYFPRLRVGASSDVTAKAVSSQMPAPTPAMVKAPDKRRMGQHVTGEKWGAGGVSHTDKDAHAFRCACHTHGHDEHQGAGESDVSSAQEVRDGTHEGTDGRQREQVGQDEPDPAIDAPDVGIYIGRDPAKKVYGDLGAGPQERHGDQTHDPLECHLPVTRSVSGLR